MGIIQKRFAHIDLASGSLRPGDALDAQTGYISGALDVKEQARFGNATTIIADAAAAPQPLTNLDVAVEGDGAFGGSLLVKQAVRADAVVSAATLAVDSMLDANSDLVTVSAANGLTVDNEFNAASVFHVESASAHIDVELTAHNVVPAGQYDLGSATASWAHLFVDAISAKTVSAEVLSASVDADLNGTLHVEGPSTFVGAVSLAQLTGSAGAKFSAGNIVAQAGNIVAQLGKISASAGNLEAGGQLVVAGNADLNGALDVAAASDLHGAVTAYGELTVKGTGTAFYVENSASIAGDLYIKGNLLVDGDQVIIDTTTLRIMDKNIELAISSSNDGSSDGAGITIKGDEDHTITFYASRAGSDAFSVNENWLPEADDTYDLGVDPVSGTKYRWRHLKLAGSASVGGDLTVAGAATLQGALSVDSLAVVHEATFGQGIAVDGTGSFTGDLSAEHGTFNNGLQVVGNVSASAQLQGASLAVEGQVSGGSLYTTGTLDAGETTLGSLTVTNAAQVGSLTVDSTLVVSSSSTLADATFSGLATFNGSATVSSGSILTIAQGATLDVQGSAQYVNLTATGTGSFGALVAGGINLSPIAAATPVSTSNAGSATLFTQALVTGSMAKMELEVIASNLDHAAAWKISIAAQRKADGSIQAAAVELSKEVLAGDGMKLDVEISDNAGAIVIKAVGAAGVGTVYWDAQIVKKMVISTVDGARLY